MPRFQRLPVPAVAVAIPVAVVIAIPVAVAITIPVVIPATMPVPVRKAAGDPHFLFLPVPGSF